MKAARVYWDAERGWTIDTPFALTPRQAHAVCIYVRKMQGPRILEKLGDAREQAQNALRALSPVTLHQNLTGPSNTERVLYTE